jgi:NAD(P)-dependent dehydrogenase (short-subunit alcohol dehydrogenase family)
VHETSSVSGQFILPILAARRLSTGRSVQVMTTETTEEEYNRLWATNVVGLFDVTARLTPLITEGA